MADAGEAAGARRAPRAGPAWLREGGGGHLTAERGAAPAGGGARGGWELTGGAAGAGGGRRPQGAASGLRTPRGAYETPRFLKAVPFAGSGRKTWGNILQDLDNTTALLTKQSSEKETSRNLATPASPQVRTELSFSLAQTGSAADPRSPLTFGLPRAPAHLGPSPIAPVAGRELPLPQYQGQPRFPGMGYPMEPVGIVPATVAPADRTLPAPPSSEGPGLAVRATAVAVDPRDGSSAAPPATCVEPPSPTRTRAEVMAEFRAELLGPEEESVPEEEAPFEEDPAPEEIPSPGSQEDSGDMKSSCAVASASGSHVTSPAIQPEGDRLPGAKTDLEDEEPVTAADLRALKAELVRLIDEKIEQLDAVFRDGTSKPKPRAAGMAETSPEEENLPAVLAGQARPASLTRAAAAGTQMPAPRRFSDLQLKSEKTSLAESWSELLSSPLGKAAHAASENRVGRTLPSATRAPALGVGLRAAPKLSHSAAHVVGVGFSGRFGEAAEPTPPSRLNDKSSSQHMEDMFRKISSRVQGLGGVKAGSRAQEHEDRMRDLSRNIQDLSLRMKFNPP